MIYLTADPHINAAPWRDNVDPIDCYNKYVQRKDYLYILGDCGDLKHRNKIVCKHIFCILGNHDNKIECQKAFGVNQVFKDKCIKYEDKQIFLHHFPFAYWDRSHLGRYHAYGHCHSNREDIMDAAFPGRRSMDVGLDNAMRLLGEYRPFTIDEYFDLLKDRPGHELYSA